MCTAARNENLQERTHIHTFIHANRNTRHLAKQQRRSSQQTKASSTKVQSSQVRQNVLALLSAYRTSSPPYCHTFEYYLQNATPNCK